MRTENLPIFENPATFKCLLVGFNDAFCYDSSVIVQSFVAVGVAINSHDVSYGKPLDTIYFFNYGVTSNIKTILVPDCTRKPCCRKDNRAMRPMYG